MGTLSPRNQHKLLHCSNFFLPRDSGELTVFSPTRSSGAGRRTAVLNKGDFPVLSSGICGGEGSLRLVYLQVT